MDIIIESILEDLKMIEGKKTTVLCESDGKPFYTDDDEIIEAVLNMFDVFDYWYAHLDTTGFEISNNERIF